MKNAISKEKYMFNIAEALSPVHPFKIKPPATVTDEHIKLLKEWVSIRTVVEASVGTLVGTLVRDSVETSVGTSVWAYVGSLFPYITKWKYCENVKVKGYPFQSAVDLWRLGLVASFDGKTWRLHSKNGVAYQISDEELRRM